MDSKIAVLQAQNKELIAKKDAEMDSKIAVLEAQNQELIAKNILLQEEKKLAEERCMCVVIKGAEDKSKLTTENEYCAEQFRRATDDLYFATSLSERNLEANRKLQDQVQGYLQANLKLMDQVKDMKKSVKKLSYVEM